ncbi:hypothetical protein SAMN04515695_0124 [Pseudovibrio sp. Tun.PSC04-5.I4]|nr:hypothetical protein SAMN04515695_0124 [Pseudovibrio sp. Tun.PSC04-5.I4]
MPAIDAQDYEPRFFNAPSSFIMANDEQLNPEKVEQNQCSLAQAKEHLSEGHEEWFIRLWEAFVADLWQITEVTMDKRSAEMQHYAILHLFSPDKRIMGLNRGKAKFVSLEQISKRFTVTRERVRQVKEKVLARLLRLFGKKTSFFMFELRHQIKLMPIAEHSCPFMAMQRLLLAYPMNIDLKIIVRAATCVLEGVSKREGRKGCCFQRSSGSA